MTRRVFLSFVALLVVLGVAVVIGAAGVERAPVGGERAAPIAIDSEAAAARLAGALRFRTLSHEHAEPPLEELASLVDYLAESFPRAHAALEIERIGELGWIYRWPGSDPALKPMLLAAHLDVVPVEESTLDRWTYPPFAGVVDRGSIWGRGTLDDKGSVVALLEAVEGLIGAGFAPRRTVMLAFGADEELGGERGAVEIAAELGRRGVELEMVLDEGSAIAQNLIPGIERPVALIGIAEKGYLSVELRVEMDGGHSSVPPRHSAIGVLAQAIQRLESRPLRGGLDGPIALAMERLASEVPWPQRAVLANLWLTRPFVEARMSRLPVTDAALRTTMATTIVAGGVKENVLPKSARAVVNFRIHPREDSTEVLEHVRRAVSELPVTVRELDGTREPSPVSPTDGAAFALLERTIRELDDVVVVPSLVLGGTDARHYSGLTDSVYRFLFFRGTEDALRGIHGVDERIGIEAYADLVRFYRRLMRNASDDPVGT